MALCFLEQVYLLEQNDLEALYTQLDDRTIGNTHLWLSTCHILTLSPAFFSHTFLLKQDDSATDFYARSLSQTKGDLSQLGVTGNAAG